MIDHPWQPTGWPDTCGYRYPSGWPCGYAEDDHPTAESDPEANR
jgi:hypothetical protein